MTALPVVICLVILFLGVSLPLALWLPERARRKALAKLAGRLGLVFAPRARSLPDEYGFLGLVRKGQRPFACNILQGTLEGHPVLVFDYYPHGRGILEYQGSRQRPASTCFLLEHEGDFPKLRVYPEDATSKLAQMLGYEDIDFESVEFSDAFCVRGKDRKFAYDVCHPRMMEYLLRHDSLCLEFARHCIALWVDLRPPKRLPVEDIPGRLKQLVDIRNQLPAYLFSD